MRILIVDDDSHVMWALRICLTREGHQVDSAANGATALCSIREQAPDFLITDIQMPYANGQELCEAIHAEFPARRFPILVMSSLTARENRAWVSSIPGVDFLAKPLNTRDLIARLGACGAQGAHTGGHTGGQTGGQSGGQSGGQTDGQTGG